jgi:O-antigen/teichoic acid export membrane protein
MRRLLKSAGTLVMGTGIAQLISLAMLPLISRLYGAEAYGEFSTYVVWAGLIVILATLQFQHAIVLPKLQKHAIAVVRTSMICVCAITILVLAGGAIFFGVWMGRGDAFAISVLLAASTAGAAGSQLMQGFSVRIGAFGSVAYASAARVMVAGALQCILGLYGFGAKGLLLAYVVGEIVATGVMYVPARGRLAPLFDGPWKKPQIIAALNRYLDFAKFGVAQEFINSLSQGLPVLVLGLAYGPAAAGAYAAIARLLGAPVQLVGNATRQAIYRELAQESRDETERLRLFQQVTLWLTIPAVGVALVVMPWVGDLSRLLLGAGWDLAGAYAPALCLWFAWLVGNSPATVVFRVLRRQDLSLYYNLVLLVLRGGVIWIAAVWLNSVQAVNVYAGVGVVMNIAYVILAYQLLRSRARKGVL